MNFLNQKSSSSGEVLARAPESEKPEFRYRIYRKRYLVPNAVTLGNMFCGYLAIMYATSNRFQQAVISIAIAILLDGLDGRVARRLNATSKFGMEFDSFSDVISFGVAPAVLTYYWGLKVLADEFGVFVTFIYVLCAASRLARFNLADENAKSFNGLPTPGAAGLVAAIVNFRPVIQQDATTVLLSSLVMLVLAFLMVSHITFFSIKSLKMKSIRVLGRVSLGALIALIWYDSKIGCLALTLSYCFSGPLGAIFPIARLQESEEETPELEDDFH